MTAIDDAIEAMTALIAKEPDVVIAVRLHPSDLDVMWTACANRFEEREERERRELIEASLGPLAGIAPIASIPLFLDADQIPGTPKLVRRSDRAEHEQWKRYR